MSTEHNWKMILELILIKLFGTKKKKLCKKNGLFKHHLFIDLPPRTDISIPPAVFVCIFFSFFKHLLLDWQLIKCVTLIHHLRKSLKLLLTFATLFILTTVCGQWPCSFATKIVCLVACGFVYQKNRHFYPLLLSRDMLFFACTKYFLYNNVSYSTFFFLKNGFRLSLRDR